MRPLCVALFALLVTATPGLAQRGRLVLVERAEYRLVGIGETVTVTADAFDQQLRVESSPRISWRIDNPSVATVSPRGVVTALTVGSTRLWALSGRDSASTTVVVSLSPNTIDFTPALVRFEAAGSRLAVRIRVRDSAGALLEDLSRTGGACRSLDERVATLVASRQVLSRGTGMTYIQCRSRGAIDSVRVEVGHLPAQVVIANAPNGSVSVGDTVRYRVRVTSSTGATIAGASATWTSLDADVVGIDPVTGFARALGPGQTGIIARVGEISDTARVSVHAAPSVVALRLDPIFPQVGDTLVITATVRDSSGSTVTASDRNLALRSTRPWVVLVVGGQRVVALNPGTAWLVATSGNLSDSILVVSRARSTVAVTSRATPIPAVGERGRVPRDTARAAVVSSRSTLRVREKFATVTATASQTSHKSRLAQGLDESRSGLLLGGAAAVAASKALVISSDFRVGTLGGDNTSGSDVKITEIDGQLTYSLRPWLALRTGYARRSESTNLVLHHWQFANATAMTRFAFAGGAIKTFSAISLLPWASFSGHFDNAGKPVSPNKTSFAVELGAELQTAPLSAGIGYSSERFSFPAVNGIARQDQFSSLRLRIGLQTGLWR